MEEVTNALETSGGVIGYAARKLRCSRTALYNFIARHPELEDVRTQAREAILDTAEHNVIAAVKGGDLKVSRWLLDRLGRHRGYTTRQEVAGVEDQPLQISAIERVLVDPDPTAHPDYVELADEQPILPAPENT
ncbi:MAG TPA: hypothetical protein VNT52_17285 [Acidimicrobiales bacterium]|nr:hypothetical protein [Acidimicrobiales bacterium]